ncbi:hypothetical protein OTK51_12400 [Vibrio scophthalmi]|uniref:DUF6559 family protein n=1 Tax=Vibrio scophthalmi TaxID=45658 RepID=UPI0022834E7F|nr:DUF6559 family protein [Vibrio scophthalmi]MCY9804228.1 hypothetical protein [Vibrio scophthalmi]
MIRYIQRRRIKKVIKNLSPVLVKGFGSRDFFTVGQVEAKSQSLSRRQQEIAFALFANPQDLDLDENSQIGQLRKTISYDFFFAKDYNAQDVVNLLGAGGWKGGRMDDGMSHWMGMNSRY